MCVELYDSDLQGKVTLYFGCEARIHFPALRHSFFCPRVGLLVPPARHGAAVVFRDGTSLALVVFYY